MNCIGVPNLVEIGQTAAEIWPFLNFSKMAAAAILDFSNFKVLTVTRRKRAELRRRAKFGRNRPKRGRDMAIFRLFKMAAAAILDFSNFIFLTVRPLKSAELRRRAKFGRNRSIHGRDMPIFMLRSFQVVNSCSRVHDR